MRCKCGERLVRARPDGLLITGRYFLLKKSEGGEPGQILVKCRSCHTLTDVRPGLRRPTLVRTKERNADK